MKRRNRGSNEANKKLRDSMSRAYGEIVTLFQYPLLIKLITGTAQTSSIFVTPKKTTVDLTATSNSEHVSVDTNDD